MTQLPTNYTLTPFQEKGSDRQVKGRRHFLFFRMGLGKTPTTIRSLYQVSINGAEFVLILCPKNAIRVWEDHIKEWFAGLDSKLERTIPYQILRPRKGRLDQITRQWDWKQYTKDKSTVKIFITTYAGFLEDIECLPKFFHVVINDEAKRILGRKSKAFLEQKSLTKNSETYYWPLTGTPGHLPKDVWPLFHLADQKTFGSYWKFVGMYHYTMKNEWQRQEVLGLKNKEQWYWLLNQKASIVTKEMVKDQLPQQNRQLLPVRMDSVQQLQYQMLRDEMVAQHGDFLLAVPNTLSLTLRLRQLLVCPKILDPGLPSYGAAIEDFIDGVAAGETDPHAVIFTPFTDAFPYFTERLKMAGLTSVITLQGSLDPDDQQRRLELYRRQRGVAICSIRYAQAFSLEPATESFHIGYEWDPDDNAQAESRLVRMTSDADIPINHYYYAYEDSYDYDLCSILNIKQRNTNTTYDPKRVGLKF